MIHPRGRSTTLSQIHHPSAPGDETVPSAPARLPPSDRVPGAGSGLRRAGRTRRRGEAGTALDLDRSRNSRLRRRASSRRQSFRQQPDQDRGAVRPPMPHPAPSRQRFTISADSRPRSGASPRRVPAELLHPRMSQHERRHGLGDHPHGGTAVTSLRSATAFGWPPVAMSTVSSGRINVLIDFITLFEITRGSPVVILLPGPPAPVRLAPGTPAGSVAS